MSDEDLKNTEETQQDTDHHPHEEEPAPAKPPPKRELGEFERSDHGEEDLT